MTRRNVIRLCVYGTIAVGLALIAIPTFVMCGGSGSRKMAQRNACINNLRQIDGAKEQFALEHQKKKGATVYREHLLPFLKHSHDGFPKCPAGGSYTVGFIDEPPRCSLQGHTLN